MQLLLTEAVEKSLAIRKRNIPGENKFRPRKAMRIIGFKNACKWHGMTTLSSELSLQKSSFSKEREFEALAGAF